MVTIIGPRVGEFTDLGAYRDVIVRWDTVGAKVAGRVRRVHGGELVALTDDDGVLRHLVPIAAKALKPLRNLPEGAYVTIEYVGLGEKQAKNFVVTTA